MKKYLFTVAIGCSVCFAAVGCNDPMDKAIANCDKSRIKELLASGEDPNGMEDGITYLELAVARDDKSIVAMLIAAGGNVSKMDAQGRTPIFAAVGKEMATLLVGYGAKTNIADNNGNTPLHCVSSCSVSQEVLAFYVENGVDINAVNNEGETPLCKMAKEATFDGDSVTYSSIPLSELRKKYFDKVKEIVRLGAKVDIPDANGMSAIHYAAQGPSPELLQFFVANTTDVNLKTKDGLTPFFCAAISECPENMDILIKAGVDIKKQVDRDGMTPLHLASAAICSVNVKRLIAYGINVNAIDQNKGRSALHMICEKIIRGSAVSHFENVPKQSSRLWKITGGKSRIEAEKEVVLTLLAGGINTQLKDSQGHTAAEVARENSREDIAKLIVGGNNSIRAESQPASQPKNENGGGEKK